MNPNDNGNPSDTPSPDDQAIPQGAPTPDDGNGGSIADQNGTPASGQPAQGADPAEENKRLKGQISALQRQIIQARRSQGTPQNPATPPGQPGDPNGDVGQKIAIAYEIADGQMRRQMEDIYSLYPELTAPELQQIRRNPWAYCSREAFMQGDVETAKLEVEQYIADLVESRANGTPAPQVPAGKGVTPNPAPAPAKTPAQDTQEDWALPMDQLEKKVSKIKAQRQ